jgi:hypothetical protein
MLYLMIFAALALGFYAQTNIGSQLSANERRNVDAQLAAESGVKFIRYHLSALSIPHLTTAQRIEEIYMQLGARLDGTANLAGGATGYDGNQIDIPDGKQNYIPLYTGGPGFHINLKLKNDGGLVCKVTGRHRGQNSPGRAIEVTFAEQQIPAPLLSYGMAARGPVELAGNAIIKGATNPATGSILIAATTSPTTPELTMTGPSTITGDVYMTNKLAVSSVAAGCSIGGTVDPVLRLTHIHKPVSMPEFPTIDTLVFKPYATTNYAAGLLNYKNIRIPPNTNPTFGSGVTIEGVCWVEAPNVVTFAGSCTLRGSIVGPNTPPGTLLTNIIEFKGSATAFDISTLPNTVDFPPALKALTGCSVVTPGFHLKFSGGYAAISGTLASSQLSFSGKSGGAITGYVLGVGNQKLSVAGNSELVVERPTTNMWPAGLYFRHYYVPQIATYLEVVP